MKNEYIGFKVSEFDNERIRAKAMKSKLSLSAYVRTSALEKEIKIIEFDHRDVVRHPLVSKIIRAYQTKSTDDKD